MLDLIGSNISGKRVIILIFIYCILYLLLN
jgi:hypothetical protein